MEHLRNPWRRTFLLGAGAGLASLALPFAAAAAAPEGRVLGFGRGTDPRTREPFFVAGVGDLARRTATYFSMGFFGHGVAFRPKVTHRAVVFEKKGPGACEIDLVARQVVREIPPRKNHHFYGHGVFVDEGRSLLAVETDLATNQGALVIRDGATLKEIGSFPTYGLSPHDCILIENGKVLMVANGGGPQGGEKPNVAFIEVESHKLLDKVEPPSERVNAGHVAMGAQGDVVLVSAMRTGMAPDEEGGVAIRPAGGKMVQVKLPAELGPMTGEALSVQIDPARRVAAVTHPDANRVSFWDLARARFLSSISIPSPRGLVTTADGAGLVVSHSQGKLGLVSWSTRELERRELTRGETPFGGSHLYRLA